MENIFEAIMVASFGVSWPLNIAKAWRSRTAKSTSIAFYSLIWLGYAFGIASKVLKMQKGISTPVYVWFFYVLNIIMVSAGVVIYFRNKKLDAENDKK